MSDTVKRIYQGRVVRGELYRSGLKTQVLIEGKKPQNPNRISIKNNTSWEEYRDWKSLLLDHHKIFQDAVNYYLLCFVALTENEKRPSDNKSCPVYRLRKQMKKKWEDFTYKGTIRNGMQKSVTKYLFPDKPKASFEECLKKVIDGNTADKTSLHKTLTALLKNCAGNNSIKQKGREFAPAFFWKNYSGEGAYKEGSEANEINKGFEKFKSELWNDDILSGDLANKTNPKYVLRLTNGSHTGENLKRKLKEGLTLLKDTLDSEISDKEIEKIENITNKKIKEGLQIPSYRGGGGNIGPRSKAFILFKYVEPNEATRKFLRKYIARPKKSDESEKNQTDNNPLAVNGKDPIKFCRGDRGYIFPAFTALGGQDPGKPQWKEFDIAAFKEALTVIHQVDEKTKEREKEKQKIQKELDWMEKQQWTEKKAGQNKIKTKWTNSEKEDREEPPFIGHFEWNEDKTELEDKGDSTGDPRIKRLRKLLEKEFALEYFGEDDERGKIPYGLKKRTLRGFNEIQKKWRSKSKNKSFSEELKKKLVEELNKYQKKNKYIVGSAPLFKELLEKENWIIWEEPTEEEQRKYNEQSFSENPLDALCDWYELKEDIEKLDKPIQFTPADPEHSRRLFRFGDVASGFNHDPDSLSFRAPIIKRENGDFKKENIKIHYSAPRLFRDSLREESEEELKKMPWLQPMMSALGFSNPLEQDFSKCNVQMMPDKTRSGEWRFLLNFPINLKVKTLQEQMTKNTEVDWQKNCKAIYNKKARYNKYLKWPPTGDWPGDKKMDNVDWFKKTDQFHCLSVDLGQRTAGAFSLITATNEKAGNSKIKNSRYIGSTNDKKWFARVKAMGVLKLPGENMQFFQKGILKTEPYGYKGRKASKEEHEEAKDIMSSLIGQEAVTKLLGGKEEQEKLSFPELNDKLLVAIRWSQGKLSHYYRWAWMLGENDKKENDKKEKALKEMKEQEDQKEWSELAKKEGNAQKLQTLVKGKIPDFQKKIEKNLLTLANRILPLRGRKWEWIQHPEKSDCPDCHLLKQTDYGTDTTNKKIHGQRGLSMKRIEQIEKLRCRFQSLNQSQRKKPGTCPPSWSEMRKDPVPDPCPDLLKKLEEIKKQRVNQTAHLILAEALGVRLKAPSQSREERKKKDIHGEYEKARDPVHFIVIEDLSRYLAKQDRSPSENSRLMKWSHRAVTKKLQELCEPYGIPVLEVPAAYSSRFCSRTGIPGFRAEEITIEDKNRYPYKKWLEEQENEDNEEKSRREFLKDTFDKLKKHKARFKNSKLKTALVPKAGGPIFVPITEHKQGALRSVVMQADINAAISIGLRAIASPLVEEIHHRIRSEIKGKSESKKIVVSKTGSIEKRRFKTGSIEKRRFKTETKIESINKKSHFFIDRAKIADFETATINNVMYASGKAIWTKINQKQWDRCKELNSKK